MFGKFSPRKSASYTTLPGKAGVILIFREVTEKIELDPDDTPVAKIKVSLTRTLPKAKSKQPISFSQMWKEIDIE